MRWFARVLHKIAISAKLARTPTVATYPRPRRRHIVSGGTLDTVDTIDDMRHVIATLGGWERHESDYSYASTEASIGTAAATDVSQATASGSEYRDSSFSASATTLSIRVAARGTRTRPGILNWNGSGKGKEKGREVSMCSFSELEDTQEVLEDQPAPPPRGVERRHDDRRHAIYDVHDVHDDSTTDSSKDTEIAAIILSRSFGYSLRRAPTNQTI